MDRQAILATYVAKKLANMDPMFAEARENMSQTSYVTFVLNQPIASLPSEWVKNAEKAVQNKFNLPKHRALFLHPTIKQRITDVTGKYTVDDIMAFFSQETGLPAKQLNEATIGGQTMTRPALIWAVEKLEAATGKELAVDTDAPLAYLGENVTLRDIANYFASSDDECLKLRRLYARKVNATLEAQLKRFKKVLVSAYRICADVPASISDQELFAKKLVTCVPSGCTDKDWDLPIFWLADELNLTFPSPSLWVTEKTTVSDLFKKVVALKTAQLQSK